MNISLGMNGIKPDTIAFSKPIIDPRYKIPIVNIIIDGINLGLTFRNQFKDILEKNNFDLDLAIEEWKPLNITE